MLKRVILVTAIILTTFISIDLTRVLASSKVELKSFTDSSETITYFNSNEKVMIPQEISVTTKLFKAVYVSTLENKDFLQSSMDEDVKQQFQKEYLDLLDTLQENHFNVVIFEIRPLLDAYYPSVINPWSQFLTGKEGQFISWDPLDWMLEEAHERHMEFHAQLNPYLVSHLEIGTHITKKDILNTLSPTNYAVKHPEEVVLGNDQKLYLNPAIENVKSYLLDTVKEIIENYPVDAIHFNSSFYPLEGLAEGSDEALFHLSNRYNTIEDFRIDQVNDVLHRIDTLINNYNLQNNRSIQLGVSHQENFKMLDLDTLLRLETVDYVIANVPHRFEEEGRGYADEIRILVDKFETSDINLYIGKDLDFSSMDYQREYRSYLLYNSNYPAIKGVALDNFITIKSTERSNYIKTVNDEILSSSLLLPEVKKTYSPQFPVLNFQIKRHEDGLNITWDRLEDAKFYVLYRMSEGQTTKLADIQHPSNILKVISNNTKSNVLSFVDADVKPGYTYKYALTVIDQANKETQIPIVQDYNLSIQENQKRVFTLFLISSILGLIAVTTSSIIVLKK